MKNRHDLFFISSNKSVYRKNTVIFIEGKIKAIQLVNARVIVQTVLLSFFSVFIFSMPSKVILILIEFMFFFISPISQPCDC